MEDPLRKTMAQLARKSCTRRVGGIGRPVRWTPESIPDPETGMGMTDGAAWFLIAECLENPKIKMRRIQLDKPPGAIAYAFNVVLASGHDVYIKFEVLTNATLTIICARSFHISTVKP